MDAGEYRPVPFIGGPIDGMTLDVLTPIPPLVEIPAEGIITTYELERDLPRYVAARSRAF